MTGKEWLLCTRSHWESEKCAQDRDAYAHPAPFMLRDAMKLVGMFTKKGMTVLDPFAGSGTALLAAGMLGRQSVGIDINGEYKILAKERLKKERLRDPAHYRYWVGDALEVMRKKKPAPDYILTSPPYHNILRNGGGGIRQANSKGHRTGARIGVEYYSDNKKDLGNCETYGAFLLGLSAVMAQCLSALPPKKYCTIIMSDFTVDKKEVCVQGDIVRLMTDIGFEFCGTTALIQKTKPLYPFGYPYAYKINHQHQNIMHFRAPPD